MRQATFVLCATVLMGLPSGWAQPPKPPAFPPINAAQARLDQTLGGTDGPCYALAVPDGATEILLGGERGNLLSWPKTTWIGVRSGESAPDITKAHDGPITALAWSSAGVGVSSGADRKLLIWAVPQRDVRFTIATPGIVRSVAVSPNGKLIAYSDESGVVSLVDAATGSARGACMGHTDWVLALAFSPDSLRLVSAGLDGQILVWDPASAKKVLEMQVKPAAVANMPPPVAPAITSLAFRADGKVLTAGTATGIIHFLNPADGKLIRSIPTAHGGVVTSLAFHPQGAVLASGGKDRLVKLWNADNGTPVIQLDGHTAWVQGVAFVEKGTRLISASADQTVKVWDLTPKK